MGNAPDRDEREPLKAEDEDPLIEPVIDDELFDDGETDLADEGES